MGRNDVIQAGEVRLARVESVRALAALAVLLGHLWVYSHADSPQFLVDSYWHRLLYGGGFGVFVFFALSGYLLFWPFARLHFGAGEPVDLRAYARNRALRILPLYVLAVLALGAAYGASLTDVARHLLLLEAAWKDTLFAIDPVLWSVSVEVQFYALLPLLAAVLARVARRRKAAAALVLAGLAVVSTVLRHRLVASDGALWGYHLPTTFQFFVGGMTVALLRLAWQDGTPPWLRGVLARSDAWVLASLPLWALVIQRFDLQELIVPASFLLVGALVLPLREGLAIRILEWRPLALLGVASYSLYVWHVPIIGELDGIGGFAGLALAATPLCIAAAAVSYRLVEAPPLRLRRRWARSSAPQSGR